MSICPLCFGPLGYDPDIETDAGVVRHSMVNARVFSARQLTIISLIVAGQTRHQIASEIGIAAGTVAYHLGAIYRMSGVKGRNQFVALFGKQIAAHQNIPEKEGAIPATPGPGSRLRPEPLRQAAVSPPIGNDPLSNLHRPEVQHGTIDHRQARI